MVVSHGGGDGIEACCDFWGEMGTSEVESRILSRGLEAGVGQWSGGGGPWGRMGAHACWLWQVSAFGVVQSTGQIANCEGGACTVTHCAASAIARHTARFVENC